MDDLFDMGESPIAMDAAEGFESFDGFEAEEGFEDYAEADYGAEDYGEESYGFEDYAEADYGEADYGEAGYGFEDYAEADYSDAADDLVADALDAEDTEEFFRRIGRVAGQAVSTARRVGRRVGQVARTVAPIASAIPLPQAQAIGRIANIAGGLLADGADDFELLDSLIDLAEEEGDIDAPAPIIAGLTVRNMLPGVTRASRPVRRQVVRSVTQATRTMVQRQGVPAARAVPQVVRTVQRTAAQRRLPTRQLPQAIRRTAARVAASPQLTRRMTQATRRQRPVRGRSRRVGPAGAGLTERYSISGPVEIVIRRW
jgi:hypothetical protein